MRPRLLRNKFLYVIILAAISALFFAAVQQGNKPDVKQIALTELVQGINSGQIKAIEVSDDRVTATQADGERVSALVGRDSSVMDMLSNLGATPEQLRPVEYTVAEPSQISNWLGILVNL